MGGELSKQGLRVFGSPDSMAIQGDYVAQAAKAAGELYGYGHTNVLFKPTKVGGKSNNAVH